MGDGLRGQTRQGERTVVRIPLLHCGEERGYQKTGSRSSNRTVVSGERKSSRGKWKACSACELRMKSAAKKEIRHCRALCVCGSGAATCCTLFRRVGNGLQETLSKLTFYEL